MVNESKGNSKQESNSTENFTVQLTNPMLYDRLHILSAEYSVSTELLVNIAVKRLIDDVEFVKEKTKVYMGLYIS